MAAEIIETVLPAQYSILSAETANGELTPIGVLLEDTTSHTLYARLRRDFAEWADPADLEVLEALEDDLAAKADPGDLGAEGLFVYLEESLSNGLRVSDREAIEVDDFHRALNRLYRQNVQSNVLPFRTHVPLYSLRVAAGEFLENQEVTQESWVETPPDLRLTGNMFAARIAGHSMEPLIPDGSLCAFRRGVTGSRDGRLVLVVNLETDGNDRYTVKRYRSVKDEAEGAWRHGRIRLESLNPDYPSWDLDPEEEKYRVIAEFVRVLE
jgi:phage repressor protein C with HTH and peptisase S24 domain